MGHSAKYNVLGSVSLALPLIMTGCSQSASVPPDSTTPSVSSQQAADFTTYSAETFFDTTSISGNSFSADGSKILITSDESGIFSLYEVAVKTGEKTRLTHFDDSTYAVRYFPDDDRLLFTKDSGEMSVIISTSEKQMAR